MSMKSLKGNKNVIMCELLMKKNLGLPHKIQNNPYFSFPLRTAWYVLYPKWIIKSIPF